MTTFHFPSSVYRINIFLAFCLLIGSASACNAVATSPAMPAATDTTTPTIASTEPLANILPTATPKATYTPRPTKTPAPDSHLFSSYFGCWVITRVEDWGRLNDFSLPPEEEKKNIGKWIEFSETKYHIDPSFGRWKNNFTVVTYKWADEYDLSAVWRMLLPSDYPYLRPNTDFLYLQVFSNNEKVDAYEVNRRGELVQFDNGWYIFYEKASGNR